MQLTIRAERRKRGWTQTDVAKAVGLSLAAIQKIETGQRKPSYDTMCKLEDLFGLNHRDLFKVSGGGTSTA